MRKLGKKQHEDNTAFQATWDNIVRIVSRADTEKLVHEAADEITRVTKGKRVGYAWSGGKDSQALRVVCEMAGIDSCVLGMSHDLEYPEFLQWVTDEMPAGLDVISNEALTLDWLSKNQNMLFPQDSQTAAKWFRLIQHRSQRIFYKRYNLGVLVLGRRHQDSNYTGKDGTGIYTDAKNVTRYSPIRFWTHEQVLAVCYYYGMNMPPFYSWPNGWVVGTGCWPARQWTGNTQRAWSEVAQIDPTIVQKAASYLPSARAFVGGV